MNEPAQVVRAILQPHDLHALPSLRLLLTDHTLDDVDENEKVAELDEVGELVGKLAERLGVLVHKVDRGHRSVPDVLVVQGSLVPLTCVFEVVAGLVLRQEVRDVRVQPDGFDVLLVRVQVGFRDQRLEQW